MVVVRYKLVNIFKMLLEMHDMWLIPGRFSVYDNPTTVPWVPCSALLVTQPVANRTPPSWEDQSAPLTPVVQPVSLWMGYSIRISHPTTDCLYLTKHFHMHYFIDSSTCHCEVWMINPILHMRVREVVTWSHRSSVAKFMLKKRKKEFSLQSSFQYTSATSKKIFG